MRRHPLALVLCVLLGCGADPTPPPKPAPVVSTEKADAPPPPREDGRLPALARPVRYDVVLDIDPRKERFRGSVTMDLEIEQRTFHIVLHGRDLKIARAVAVVGADENPAIVTTRAAAASKLVEEIVLTFSRPLDAGAGVTLKLDYDAPFAADLEGLYRSKVGDAWYAYTDFEPTDARKMIPCFDEPAYKALFDVRVTTPKGMLAVSNAPETSRAETEAGTTYSFLTTKPLPTYLLALAVGDFDVREGAKTPVPIRVITTKGKGALADLALEAGAGLTAVLENYLKVPFPFPKLDLVAVPEFAAGAMENAGLITFRQELLLVDSAHAGTRAKRALASVTAHEIAHQWFGDLVTAEWWNDLWLNEAMATWMQSRTVTTWKPELGTRYDLEIGSLSVMDQDGLANARAVRQPVRTAGEAREAFDGITYTKGAAVLGMLEDWVGPAAFQGALHDYLIKYSFKNATAESLLAGLDVATKKNVSEVANTFLNLPGVPLLTAHLECEQHGRWFVELRQEPWRPLGSTAPDTQQTWSHPVCVRAEGQKEAACTVLEGGAPSLVAGTGKCPAWIFPNDRGTEYFRFTEAPPELAALAKAVPSQDAPDRIAFVSNAWAAVRAGAMGPEQILKMLPAFDKETERVVIDVVAATLSGMNDTVVEDDARKAFRSYVAARFAKHKASIGWTPAPNEDEERALLRRTVLFAMGDLAGDAATLREAEPLAQAWLRDPGSVQQDAAANAVELASRSASDDRLTALREAAKTAKSPQDRIIALRGMGAFDDGPVLERALDVFLTDEIKPAEAPYILGTAASRRATRAIVQTWIESRWDKLRAKLPGNLSRGLIFAAGLSCTKVEKDAAAAFFAPRVKDIPASARPFAASIESSTLCSELRLRGTAATSKALRAMGAKS